MSLLDGRERFAVNSEEVVAKVVDGEAIIINLATGLYYSADGVAAQVWEALAAGRSVDEASQSIAGRFAIDRDVAQEDVRTFVQQVLEEGLIAPSDEKNGTAEIDSVAGAQADTYAPPRLTRYDDLAHFFALDPPLPTLDEDDQKIDGA